MFDKIKSFIPKHVSNGIVVIVFDVLRMIQRLIKHNPDKNTSSNETSFKTHVSSIKNAGGFIEDQNNYTDMKYGRATMQFSGCEIFAVYNAIYAIKKTYPSSLAALISEFEKDGMVLGGLFGTAPRAILSYLKKAGYSASITTKEKDFDKYGTKYSSLILTMYNDANNILKAVHTVNISKSNGKFVAHNVNCNGKVVGPANSVMELIAMMNGGKAKGISLIGVK